MVRVGITDGCNECSFFRNRCNEIALLFLTYPFSSKSSEPILDHMCHLQPLISSSDNMSSDSLVIYFILHHLLEGTYLPSLPTAAFSANFATIRGDFLASSITGSLNIPTSTAAKNLLGQKSERLHLCQQPYTVNARRTTAM